GAESVAGSFSRRTGGPGVLGLLPPGTTPAGFGRLAADELLAHPFSDQELLAAVHRAGTAPRAAAAPPRPRVESKLTSQDIFGDVLAEVELAGGDEAAVATAPPPPPPRPAPSPAVSAAPAAPRPAPPRQAMDDDLNRKLEQTLSGVFGSDLGRARPSAPVAASPAPPPPARPAAAAAPAKPAPPPPARPAAAAPPRTAAGPAADDDIDAILSRTLGSLEMGPRSRPAAPPAAPRPVAQPAPAVPPALAAPPAPAAFPAPSAL